MFMQKKEEEIYESVHELALENVKLTSTVHDEAVEKIENWPNFWIHKMMANKKKCNGQHCPKAKRQRNL